MSLNLRLAGDAPREPKITLEQFLIMAKDSALVDWQVRDAMMRLPMNIAEERWGSKPTVGEQAMEILKEHRPKLWADLLKLAL